MASTLTNEPTASRNRWFQFRLRTLMVLIALVGVGCYFWRVYLQDPIKAIEYWGGSVYSNPFGNPTEDVTVTLHGSNVTVAMVPEILRQAARLEGGIGLQFEDIAVSKSQFGELLSISKLRRVLFVNVPLVDDDLDFLESTKTLCDIHIENSKITGKSIVRLSEMDQLKWVYLADNPLVRPGEYAPLGLLPQLYVLYVHNANFDDEDLSWFAGHRELATLDLYNTKVTEQSLLILDELPPKLEHLNLKKTRVSEADGKDFGDRHPKLFLLY